MALCAIPAKEASCRKKANLPRFGFDFVNNCIDGPDHAVDVVQNISAFDCSNFAKAYSEGKLGFVLPLDSSLCDCVRYLILAAAIQHDGKRVPHVGTLDVGQLSADYGYNGGDDLVLGGITLYVNCKKEITPTCVRLIAGEKVFNLLRESLAGTVYATLEVSFGPGERKVNIIGRKASKARDIASCKIKSGPQVFDRVNCMLCEGKWKRFRESQLVPFVNAVKIWLNDKLAWCSLEVDIGAPYEIGKAFLSPLEPKPRIGERYAIPICSSHDCAMITPSAPSFSRPLGKGWETANLNCSSPSVPSPFNVLQAAACSNPLLRPAHSRPHLAPLSNSRQPACARW